jgi:hypothetical protein
MNLIQYLKNVEITTYIILLCLISSGLFIAVYEMDEFLLENATNPFFNFVKSREISKNISKKLFFTGLAIFSVAILLILILVITKINHQ